MFLCARLLDLIRDDKYSGTWVCSFKSEGVLFEKDTI